MIRGKYKARARATEADFPDAPQMSDTERAIRDTERVLAAARRQK